jgi:hypothetical protein
MTEIIIELNKYLVIGTPVVDVKLNKSIKFLNVGSYTKNCGGHANNSLIGLNAVVKIYSIGSAMNMAIGTNIK